MSGGRSVGSVYISPDPSLPYPAALWKPDQASRKTYALTLLPILFEYSPFAVAYGINDLGDFVGGDFDESWHFVATRWSTGNTSLVQPLGFPGVQRYAVKVNNKRIAVGEYTTSVWPPNQAAAVKFK